MDKITTILIFIILYIAVGVIMSNVLNITNITVYAFVYFLIGAFYTFELEDE